MIFYLSAINSIKLQGLHFYIIDINLSGNRRVKTRTNFQPILKRVWGVGAWRWLGCCLWWRVTQQRPLFRGPWAACSASGSAFYPSDPSATKLGGNWETPWFETKTQKRIFPAPISANCKPEQHLKKSWQFWKWNCPGSSKTRNFHVRQTYLTKIWADLQ